MQPRSRATEDAMQQDAVQHQRDLDGALQEIVTLLNRQEVVSDLVERQATTRRDLVKSLLERQQSVELQRRLERLHPADVAYTLENLPLDKRQMLWKMVRDRDRGAVLLELSGAVRESLIGGMGEREVMDVAAHLDASQIAQLMPTLPRELALDLLNTLDRDNRGKIQSALAFPRGSVGALMDYDMVTVRADMTIEEVLGYFRRNEQLPDNVDQVFVIDHDGILQGVLPVRELIRNLPQRLVQELVRSDGIVFYTDDDARETMSAFERYDLISAPVVNLHRQLVGVVNVDRILDFKEELAQMDRLHQVGLTAEEDLFGPVWSSARNRWIWLGLNLTTAFIASRVIGLFEDTIEQLVALAALMPIVASIGGNTGNQTVALMIRGIALRQIGRSNFRRFLAKELGVSLVNGALWGAVVAAAAYLIYLHAGLSLVMLLAMAGNLVIAALAGVFIPATLRLLGRDPVMGSSVIVTAITDSMGFFMFLGAATLLLV
jgi:magnesium transporter